MTLVKVIVEIEVPEGATHYGGSLTDDPTWYKCTQIGVVGAHWWYYSADRKSWIFMGHFPPHFYTRICPLS